MNRFVKSQPEETNTWGADRKSTRLNSSHGYISYAVFCLKKKKTPISRSFSYNYNTTIFASTRLLQPNSVAFNSFPPLSAAHQTPSQSIGMRMLDAIEHL